MKGHLRGGDREWTARSALGLLAVLCGAAGPARADVVGASSYAACNAVAPQDVANACLFLVSDLSSYLTGVTLDVNGGMLIH